MKKFYYSFLLLILSIAVNAQTSFIMKYKTNNPQTNINVPIINTGTTNYTVTFGDGSQLTNQIGPCSHIYNNSGTYTVTITGNYDKIDFGQVSIEGGDLGLISIEQWGSAPWKSMDRAFYRCSNLIINSVDVPNLSQVTSMKEAFYFIKGINSNINTWDVSNVTNMSKMFSRITNFNQPLNNWNVGNVTDMSEMFFQCQQFNQSLSNWNVANVTNMSGMFTRCHQFNQSLNTWDVSGVSNFFEMFSFCNAYNQPMNNWNLSSAISLKGMFSSCSAFNQPLNSWNVSTVNNMSQMFSQTGLFNQPLDNWNVSAVTDMSSMFSYTNYNQPIGMWDISNVTLMYSMFSGTNYFNQPIGNWNVSNVTDMESMFKFSVFNQSIGTWDTSNVTNMKDMFADNTYFDQPLNDWDVSNVTTMDSMFLGTTSFNKPLNSWDVSNVNNMHWMFYDASSFNQNINEWDVSNVTTTELMFYLATSFNQPLSNWNVSNIMHFNNMFFDASSFNQDISNWNFSPNANFSYQPSSPSYFLSGSGLNSANYDALLLKFAQLEFQNRKFHFGELQYCNAALRNYLVSNLGWTITGDIQDPTCSQNTISGTVLYDQNNNGCTANDIIVNNFLVTATNGNLNYGASVNNLGVYDLKVSNENYTVTLNNVPNYFTVNPVSTTVSFTDFGNTENLNFCLTSNQNVNDLNVTVLPVTEARPGFQSEYQLIVQNIGTQNVANTTVVLNYDVTKQTFVSAVPSASAAISGQLTFNFANLQSLQSKIVDFKMQTLVPPIVNGGDVINFTATVTLNTADATPQDNTFVLEQIAVNSYDPNDKQVLQGDEISIEDTDQYLDYIIRFQNTGSASAINVRIEDMLHENLDWNTLRMVSASHNYRVQITNGNEVEFIFDNINLPHESVDEPGSNGFIAYKIKSKQSIQVGDVMSGNASIFFDYNLPIITNTVSTVVVNNNLSISDASELAVVIYPNPTDDLLRVQVKNNTEIEEIKVYSLQGRELVSVQNTTSIHLKSLSAGMYIMQVKTNKGNSKHQIIKK